jgi:hypothetical protein
MNKQTKRIRRNRKNKTRKYYGGSTNVNDKTNVTDKSKGIFDIIGDKISGYSGKAINYVKDKGLRLVGLQPIQQPETTQNAATQEVDQKINEIGSAASEIIGDVKNVVDKGSAAILGNINDVLKSPQVGESLSEAASETAQIGEKLLENFNEKLSTPELKEQAKIALDNAAEYADIAVEAMDEPLNKAVDELNEAGTKAASGATAGIIKVGTDAMAAVPGAGAVIEVGKILNDVSRAVGDVAEAASEATSTVSKVVEETSKNINEGIEKLEEKKEGSMDTFKQLNKDGLKVSDRVDKSINQFENPVSSVPVVQQGGKKTRRKLFKHKGKSKRVRFAI